MAELADAADLKSADPSHEGSSPSIGTITQGITPYIGVIHVMVLLASAAVMRCGSSAQMDSLYVAGIETYFRTANVQALPHSPGADAREEILK